MKFSNESGQVISLNWGDLGPVGRTVVAVVGLLFGGLILFGVVTFVVSVYPDSLKLTAPILCPDDLPDSEVGRYRTGTDPPGPRGEGVNFSLICSNSRGEFKDLGMQKPLALLTVWIVLAMGAIVGVLFAISRLRRRRAGSGIP
ncbi:MAG: hypothetical protein ACT4PI_05590 [Actinomycetota bacterium]